MKNTRLTSILSSSLIAGALAIGSLATQFASAQSPVPLAKVDIPFAFQTATQSLPAGTYTIDRESHHMLLMQGPGRAEGFVLTNDAIQLNTPTHSVLVFTRYGDKYYLRQVWTAGDNVGMECAKGRAEKESLQATNKQPPSSIQVAFNVEPKH
jgi:hypothetical protein